MKLLTTIAAGAFLIGSLSGCAMTEQPPIDTPEPVVTDTTNDTYIIDESDFVNGSTLIENLTVSDELTTEEVDGIILMREEEKLARDVYQALGDMRGQKIFTNIASSEQTHMDAIGTLIERYDLEDPITDDMKGVFTSSTLQSLYDNLVAQGSQSLTDALTVGITIEDLDIADLEKLMSQTTRDDILTIYDNLTRGSRNHMRAFYRQLTRQGADYTPQYISAEQFQSIISSDQERGSDSHGNGKGRR